MVTSVVSGKVAEKFFRMKSSLESKKFMKKQTSIDLNILRKDLHQSEQLTVTLMKIYTMKRFSREERKEFSMKYLQQEMELHDGDKSEVVACLKQTVANSTVCSEILEDLWPGILTRCCSRHFSGLMSWIKSHILLGTVFFIIQRFLKIFLYYLDVLKDSSFAATLLVLVGPSVVFLHPDNFASQITIIYLLTVILPILISTLQVASEPSLLMGFEDASKRETKVSPNRKFYQRLLSLAAVIFFPLIPAILIDLKEREKNRLSHLIQESDSLNQAQIRERQEFIKKISNNLLCLKQLEFGIEIVPQITILTIMIFLNKSSTKTVSGLESVFQQSAYGIEPDTFISLSIVWMFGAAVRTFIKTTKEAKDGFLPASGQLLLGLRALVSLFTRIIALIFYWIPFLGCLQLATHWKSKSVKLDLNWEFVRRIPTHNASNLQTIASPSPENFTFPCDDKLCSVPWSSLFR